MTRVVLHPEVFGRRLDDELVLVHLGTDRIFALNDTGARIWEHLQAGADLADVRERLLEEFDVAAETLDAELEAFVRELEERQFLTRSDG